MRVPFRGLPSQAFEYIHYNQGIMAEDAYPYTGQVPREPPPQDPQRPLCTCTVPHASPAASLVLPPSSVPRRGCTLSASCAHCAGPCPRLRRCPLSVELQPPCAPLV